MPKTCKAVIGDAQSAAKRTKSNGKQKQRASKQNGRYGALTRLLSCAIRMAAVVERVKLCKVSSLCIAAARANRSIRHCGLEADKRPRDSRDGPDRDYQHSR